MYWKVLSNMKGSHAVTDFPTFYCIHSLSVDISEWWIVQIFKLQLPAGQLPDGPHSYECWRIHAAICSLHSDRAAEQCRTWLMSEIPLDLPKLMFGKFKSLEPVKSDFNKSIGVFNKHRCLW